MLFQLVKPRVGTKRDNHFHILNLLWKKQNINWCDMSNKLIYRLSVNMYCGTFPDKHLNTSDYRKLDQNLTGSKTFFFCFMQLPLWGFAIFSAISRPCILPVWVPMLGKHQI